MYWPEDAVFSQRSWSDAQRKATADITEGGSWTVYFTQESASKAEEEDGVWTQGWYGVVLRRAFMEELLRAVRWAFEDPSRAMEVCLQ